MRAWLACIAYNIERDRLVRIASTWRQPGIDGLCLVTNDPDPPRLLDRQRNVRPVVPFSRSTWRNIAMRFCPSDIVVFMDADCVVAKPEAFAQALELVRTDPEKLVVFSPAWARDGDGCGSFLRGEIGPEKLSCWWHDAPRVVIAGTVTLRRDRAIWLSFDDDMAEWGGEDNDFCGRGRAWGMAVERAEPGTLVHVHHPPRPGRSRMSKRTNLQIAHRRGSAADMAAWLNRALREIKMAPPFEDMACPTEAVTRDTVLHHAQQAGWPALAALDAGRVPDGCVYEPLVGCVIEDRR